MLLAALTIPPIHARVVAHLSPAERVVLNVVLHNAGGWNTLCDSPSCTIRNYVHDSASYLMLQQWRKIHAAIRRRLTRQHVRAFLVYQQERNGQLPNFAKRAFRSDRGTFDACPYTVSLNDHHMEQRTNRYACYAARVYDELADTTIRVARRLNLASLRALTITVNAELDEHVLGVEHSECNLGNETTEMHVVMLVDRFAKVTIPRPKDFCLAMSSFLAFNGESLWTTDESNCIVWNSNVRIVFHTIRDGRRREIDEESVAVVFPSSRSSNFLPAHLHAPIRTARYRHWSARRRGCLRMRHEWTEPHVVASVRDATIAILSYGEDSEGGENDWGWKNAIAVRRDTWLDDGCIVDATYIRHLPPEFYFARLIL